MYYKQNFLIGLIVTGIVNLLVGFFVYSKNKRSKVNITFAFFSFTVSLWSLTQAGNVYGPTLNDSYYWARIEQVAIPFIPIFFMHFVVSLLKLKNKSSLLRFCYLFGIIIAYLALTTEFVCLRSRYKFNLIFFGDPGILYPYLIIFFVSCMLYGFYELLKAYNKAKGIFKNQLRYLVWSSSLGFIGGCSSFFLVYDINLFPLNPFGTYLVAIYVLIVTYAIVKHRFLDVSVVVTRTGIFIAVYFLVLGTPLLIIYFLENDLVRIFGLSWWIVPFLCSISLATLGPFLYIYFEKKVVGKLLKEQRNYQNILRNASKGMIRIKNLKHLLNLIVHVVSKAVRIKNIAIYLFDGEDSQYVLQAERGLKVNLEDVRLIGLDSSLVAYFQSKNDAVVVEEVAMKLREDEKDIELKALVSQLNSLNAALAIPCFLEKRLIGILILGEKRSKKLYSEDDLAVFSVLANQAALAIENAQFYDEIQRTNEQLIQAEKLATIGTMADGLSHQINNRFHALSLISGDSLDILQTSDFSGCDEKAREIIKDVRIALEKIQNNVLQGGEVVKGLLKYSRPEEGGFEPVCLIEVVSGAIEMVQYKIKLKEIKLVQNIPIGLHKLLGSRIQLQEVFFNLIDNAYDAIKERQMILKEYGYKGKIEISAVCLDGHVEIVIADNGIGVKEHDRKKLFAPFFTTKASSRKGTGLGLYVIEKIITAHQGRLSVDSNYGVGTHFVMMLPTAKS